MLPRAHIYGNSNRIMHTPPHIAALEAKAMERGIAPSAGRGLESEGWPASRAHQAQNLQQLPKFQLKVSRGTRMPVRTSWNGNACHHNSVWQRNSRVTTPALHTKTRMVWQSPENYQTAAGYNEQPERCRTAMAMSFPRMKVEERHSINRTPISSTSNQMPTSQAPSRRHFVNSRLGRNGSTLSMKAMVPVCLFGSHNRKLYGSRKTSPFDR